MRKNKSEQVDLFYLNEEEKKSKKKKNKLAGKRKPANSKSNENKKDEIFSFDDEIVIGVTKIEDKSEKKKKVKSNKKKPEQKAKEKPLPKKRLENKQVKSNSNSKSEMPKARPKVKTGKQVKNYKNAKEVDKQIKKRKKIALILKCFSMFVVVIGTVLFVLLSPTFNVKRINIIGNKKLTEKEIISLSQIELDENTFKIWLGQVKKHIESEPYVESAKISRKLPEEITIEVTERTPSFMLQVGNAYVYMNNQGYFLEISDEKLNLPIIIGNETKVEELKPGQRMIKEDLQKLEKVLRIIKYAEANKIKDKITQINIANKNDYVIYLENERKTVYLGDVSYIEKKMQYLVVVLSNIPGVAAEVFLNVDINTENFYVREKV